MLGEFPAGRASSGFFLVFAFYLASPERHEVYRRGVESFPSELDRREKRERNFSFLAPLSAESRRIRSQWRAQANSVAKMAKPIGMTTTAGPGRTSSAIPTRSTVIPITDTTTRRAYFSMAKFYQFLVEECIPSRPKREAIFSISSITRFS